MSTTYTQREILEALFETLELARNNLNQLLMTDHPPCQWPDNIWKCIADERQAVKDLEHFIYDERARVAMHELAILKLN